MAAKISPLEAGAGAVGIVSAIFGTVKAVAGNGAERILHLGDRVFANELIVTADLSGISIEFSNGGRVDLGRNSEAVLDSDLYGPAEVDRAELVSAVEAAQRAILAGADPAAILGAPAAGGGGGGEDLSSEVNPPPIIERTGLQVTPESGFETEGLVLSNTPTLPRQAGFTAQQTDTSPIVVNDPPVAVNDLVLSNIVDGSTISIPATALMRNDSDPDGDPLSLISAHNPQLGSVTWSADNVAFVPDGVFGSSAAKKSEAAESSTSNNNTPQSAVEFLRSDFGKPGAADMSSIKYQDGTLNSALFQASIIDTPQQQGGGVTRDQDWIKVELRAGETIILDIDEGDDGDRDVGTDDNDVDMFLELYDSSGTIRLAQNDDALADTQNSGGAGSVRSGYHGNSLDSYLEYTVQQDGTYYIKASAWNNSPVGIFSDNGDYKLWISIENPQFDDSAFDYTIEDGISGSDSATATIRLADSATLTGTSANEILVGRDGAGSLLQGEGGNDTLLGGDGNDLLSGGSGSDILNGGSGSDIYIFKTGESGSDTVLDYQQGEDVLDISDLLSGISITPANLGSHVQVDSNGDLRLDVSGNGNFSADAIAHLDGISSGTTITLLVDAGPALDLIV
ncbi:MAG: retention module-containing protein [Chromatiaceae bacterium]|nr:retention module-containing protein [Chromatiaceae bacterium]MCP5443983.1 retention module-containing protein [Chromatiaceae bacterium]